MTPCYVYNPKKAEKNISLIQEAFSRFFGSFILGYSFKTNMHPLILNTVKQCNLYAEVVSPEEYQTALDHGFDHSRIIFNGVCKTAEYVTSCSTNGGFVNLDNEEDFSFAENYFNKTGCPLKCGLRLNFYTGNKIKSRFGIEVNSKLYDKIKTASDNGKIIINGLSCHFTKTTAPSFWKEKAEGLATAAGDFPLVEYLDFGGSLASDYEINPATIAETVFLTLKNHNLENKTIIIESGTAVISSAVNIYSTVLHIRENGFIILDVSALDMTLPAQSDQVKLEIVPKGNPQTYLNGYTLTGYTCLENDIIKKGFSGKIAVGDQIIFKNCGAYTYCMAGNFIKNVPPFVKK